MLFNSLDFLIFFPIVFLLYWFVFKKNLQAQNTLVLVASYVFYGWWDWRFLSLIIISSIADFLIGQQIEKQEKESKRKSWLLLSMTINLGLLLYFKYFNFFVDSFIESMDLLGLNLNWSLAKIILPVGISFYTFQTMSYTIDIYRRELKANKNIIEFFAFVSFFPQLVAGPIERASDLLPQFTVPRQFSYQKSVDGLRQILYGFFKKVVIADNIATQVDYIYANYETMSSLDLGLGAIFFTIQIYCDFSGYSDIAIGTAKLFGFELRMNFNFPLYSANMTEFWRRWHMSLSNWIKDYLFTPLAIYFRNYEKKGIALALALAFTINGFWHGAAWTFLVWGILHGAVLSFESLTKKRRKKIKKKINPKLYLHTSVLLTFAYWTFSLILFRANSMTQAWGYISRMFSFQDFSLFRVLFLAYLALVVVFVWIERLQRNKNHVLSIDHLPIWIRYGIYYFLILSVIFLGNHQNQSFIYFQF
ncbi:MAG: MBOAT family protein [Flavobacteriales bacterium]|jgi:D-alanyl-lipoteichoic acid acyltransferase DltB (MBOAT superfamily)|nr:MBOAT family protein [Flavobacteriales bacterium]